MPVELTRREFLQMSLGTVASVALGESSRHETAEEDQFHDFIQYIVRPYLARRDSYALATISHPTQFRWGLANSDYIRELSPQKAQGVWADALRGRSPVCSRYYDLDWRMRLFFGENPALWVSGLRPQTYNEGREPASGSILSLAREGNRWYIKSVIELTKSNYEEPWNKKWYDLWKPCDNITLPPEYGATVFPEAKRQLAFITGFTSSFSPGAFGVVVEELFTDFQLEARDLGYGGQHRINVSWGGGHFDRNDGLFYPKAQTCEHTLLPVDERARLLAHLIVDFFTQHPNDELVILTHSEGIHPVLRMMEMAKNEDFFLRDHISKITVIATHGPVLGVNKHGFDAIVKLLPIGCKFGPTPAPGAIASPAGENLLRTWDNRLERSREIKNVVEWWRSRGGRVISGGSYRDPVLSIIYGNLPREAWEEILARGWAIPEEIATQNIPGGENHMFLLEKGHDGLWKTEEGRAFIKEKVGPQLLSAAELARRLKVIISQLPFTGDGFSITYIPKEDRFVIRFTGSGTGVGERARQWFLERGVDPDRIPRTTWTL